MKSSIYTGEDKVEEKIPEMSNLQVIEPDIDDINVIMSTNKFLHSLLSSFYLYLKIYFCVSVRLHEDT